MKFSSSNYSNPSGAFPAGAVRSEDLNKILEVARALATSRDLDDILQLIIQSACDVMQADRASVFLINEKTNELFIRVAMGEEMSEIHFPSSKGIAGHVFTTGQIVNIADAYQDSRFNPEIDLKTGYHTHSILTMPLDTGEKIVGVLQVINKTGKRAFEVYDESVMSALASQAAVSIHNFRLTQEYLKKQEMQASLNVARTIQKSLLPEKSPEIAQLEIAAYCESCEETGGDYYDYYKIDDDHLVVMIGDVTGHGVGSAILMATARAALHALWQKEQDPQILLKSLNKLLDKDMGDDRFMTAFLGVFDLKKRRLIYSSAGHDAPIIYRPERETMFELDSTGIPLGMMEEAEYPCKQAFLKPGDVIYMMTDGLWEAMNPEHEIYGRDRLFAFIRDQHEATDQTCQQLIQEVTNFCRGAPFRDDITLLTLKSIKTTGPLQIHRESQLNDFPVALYQKAFHSTPDEKNQVLDDLMALMMQEKFIEEEGEIVIRLCFDEALVNAVEHGNQNDPQKQVTVCLSRDEDYWSLKICDQGDGFINSDVPNPDAPTSLELDHGRGILIMMECLDAVWYNEPGNEIQMIRRIPQMIFEDPPKP